MSLFNKIKWILGIVLVFIIILTTNLIDRQNFNIVSDSIETIYADRLVAQDMIYDLSKLVGQKEIAYATVSPGLLAANVAPLNTRIGELVELFASTRLTPKEEIVFSRLRKSLRGVREIEAELVNGSGSGAEMMQSVAVVRKHLDELAEIQLQEGRREHYESKKAISAANLFTQLEIAALIIMAIAVQVIVIYAPKTDSGA